MTVHEKTRGGTFERRCHHFNGIDCTDDKKQCKAGVLMKSVMGPGYQYRYKGDIGRPYTSNYSLPCFTDSDPDHRCQCEKQSFPTQEEIEAHRAKTTAAFENMVKARQAIQDDAKGQRGIAGRVACPVCGSGTLGYSIAGINGHVHAHCSTKGCVAWME